ncbi:hypothetical protein KCP78_06590 [Salmonella enterica subsp. enterica]|nr:hypothetical protein KCP78_06590 [Salmonella enterica subsp. enterica]
MWLIQAAPRGATPGGKGSRWEQAVVYEMLQARSPGRHLPRRNSEAAYLAELGAVLLVEVMPVAQFGGERGWAMTTVYRLRAAFCLWDAG